MQSKKQALLMPGVDPSYAVDVEALRDEVFSEIDGLYDKGFADGYRQALAERGGVTGLDCLSLPTWLSQLL